MASNCHSQSCETVVFLILISRSDFSGRSDPGQPSMAKFTIPESKIPKKGGFHPHRQSLVKYKKYDSNRIIYHLESYFFYILNFTMWKECGAFA